MADARCEARQSNLSSHTRGSTARPRPWSVAAEALQSGSIRYDRTLADTPICIYQYSANTPLRAVRSREGECSCLLGNCQSVKQGSFEEALILVSFPG